MFLLFSFSRCTWWNFSIDEFEDKKKGSFAMPILVVCYSRWCPHCSGLPEGTQQYSDSDGNRSDVYVTMIDCVDFGRECGLFHIAGTPHIQLVIGPKRKYWPRVWSRIGTDWNIVIDKYVKPSLREITTDTELAAAIREPTDGGSTFHLETPSLDHEIVKQLANFSKEFRIYNDTFTYRINRKLSKPKLTAHTSMHCSTEWTGGNLHDFLDLYKFGSRHQYDQDEYKLMSRHGKMTVVLVEEGLVGGQSYSLEKIPEHYCSNVSFGWVSVKDSKGIMKQFQMNTTDLPALVYSDSNKCRAVYKGKTSEAHNSGFLPMALDGKLCGQVVRGPISRQPDVQVKEPEKLGGTRFIAVYVAVGMVLILGIRLGSPVEIDKQE